MEPRRKRRRTTTNAALPGSRNVKDETTSRSGTQDLAGKDRSYAKLEGTAFIEGKLSVILLQPGVTALLQNSCSIPFIGS